MRLTGVLLIAAAILLTPSGILANDLDERMHVLQIENRNLKRMLQVQALEAENEMLKAQLRGEEQRCSTTDEKPITLYQRHQQLGEKAVR